MLLATMLNYMDRLRSSQQATAISRELGLKNEDYAGIEEGFGIAFAVGGIISGFALRPDQPTVALSRGPPMLVARRVCDRPGHDISASSSSAECCSASSRPANGRRSGHGPAPAFAP